MILADVEGSNMSELKNLYAQMWTTSIDNFKNNNCELDRLIDNPADMRRGLTVLSYLDHSIGEKIASFLDEVKAIEPEQYYYPQSELHLTILSIISCAMGFKLSNIDAESYSSALEEATKNIGPFKIYFRGITLSPSCILIQGFPDDEQLNYLRNSLRAGFKKAKLEATIDSRYKLSTAHLTAIRCKTRFKNSRALINLLYKYKSYDFGTLEINNVEFVFNNWYQNLAVTKSLSSITLNAR